MKRIMVLTLSAIFTCIALCACSADTPSERDDGAFTRLRERKLRRQGKGVSELRISRGVDSGDKGFRGRE